MNAANDRRLLRCEAAIGVALAELIRLDLGYIATTLRDAHADIVAVRVFHGPEGPDKRALLNRQQLAGRLGYTVDWLYAHLAELLDAGFPPAAYGAGSAARWDPAAIDAWLDSRMPAHLQSRPQKPDMLDHIDAALTAEALELDRRSNAMGAVQ